MSNVIDLKPRLKTIAAHNELHPTHAEHLAHVPEIGSNPDKSHLTADSKAELVDFESEKKRLLFQERRTVKRTILSEVMSAMVVLPEKGLLKVALYDISEEGISFETESQAGQFKVDEEILMRVYFNQKTYFPIQVLIKHVTPDSENGVVRHGTEFQKSNHNDVALQHFVKFVELAGSGLRKDNGDLMVNRIS